MKHIIIFLAILAFPSLSVSAPMKPPEPIKPPKIEPINEPEPIKFEPTGFESEEPIKYTQIKHEPLTRTGKKALLPQACFPSAQEVRDAKKSLDKIVSKYRVVCHNHIKSKRYLPVRGEDARHAKYKNWRTRCKKSRDPHISKAREQLAKAEARIEDLRGSTMLGKSATRAKTRYDIANQEIMTYYATHTRNRDQKKIAELKKERDRLAKLYAETDDRFLSSIPDVVKAARSQDRNLYWNRDAICGNNSPDSEVYEAYKSYRITSTKCDKLSKEFTERFNQYVKLTSKYNEYTRQIKGERYILPTSSGGSGSVK